MYSRNEFKAYLSQLEITEITAKSYMRDAAQFCKYMNEKDISDVSSVTKENIDEYCAVLIEKGQAVVNVQRKIASLKKLFDFLHKDEQISENPSLGIRMKKQESEKPKVLTKEQINKLLSMPLKESMIGMRDKAMLELICATGIKVTELVNTTTQSICFDSHALLILRRDKITRIALDKTICAHLKDYIEKSRSAILGEEKTDTLFLNAYGKRLSRQGFWKILKNYSEKAMLSRVTSEAIRRSFAHHFVKEAKDIKRLKEILGHSDIATTKEYIKL